MRYFIKGYLITLLIGYCMSSYEDIVWHYKPIPFRGFFNNETVDVINIRDVKVSTGCKECPRVYFPVCADNNRTYTNECILKCANLKNENMVGSRKKPPAKKLRMGRCDVFPF
ncbi:hypothetical protein ACJJTC_004189 [Scirpophaga incertulas]